MDALLKRSFSADHGPAFPEHLVPMFSKFIYLLDKFDTMGLGIRENMINHAVCGLKPAGVYIEIILLSCELLSIFN